MLGGQAFSFCIPCVCGPTPYLPGVIRKPAFAPGCLQDGRVAEQGNHAELLKLDGLYASMWHKQAEMGQGATIDEL